MMGNIKLVILALTWPLVAGVLGCQPPAAPPPPAAISASAFRPATTRAAGSAALNRAKALFYRAVAGDTTALSEAVQVLKELGGAESRDPQVVAYLGTAQLLQASHAALPWDKMRLAGDGLALEDRAVAAAPGDLEIRFLRGVIEYQLPRFMGRWELAESDLAYVARYAEKAAKSGELDSRAAASDLDYHGRVLEQNYDAAGAIAAWQAAVRVDRDSPGGRDALKHLAEHHVPIIADPLSSSP